MNAETKLQEQSKYWIEQLHEAPELIEWPTDGPRTDVQSQLSASVRVAVESNLVVDLKALSRRLDVSLGATFCAAWCVVLARISGRDDFVVGIPALQRQRNGAADPFTNSLPLRVRIEDDPTIETLLRRVEHVMRGAYANQNVSLAHVMEALRPARAVGQGQIFQVTFALGQAMPMAAAQADISLSLQESSKEISGRLDYRTDLFDASTIERWAEHFAVASRAMVGDPERAVSRLPLIGADERRRVVESFNATRADFPREKLLHELFEEQVERTPGAVAVVFEGDSLTYRDLNTRANQVARLLRDKGVGPEQLVGICLERSLEMVIGLLGILKAGGAYVPIDPNYPGDRLQYMIENAAPRVLLTQEKLKSRMSGLTRDALSLDAGWSDMTWREGGNLDPHPLGATAKQLAYVIYTSGSTGKPKGAMNEHGGVINRLQWMQDRYRLDPSDRVLQKTPFSFDVSVWEFFWTLLNGACLVLARPEGHKDPEYLRRLIEANGVTTLHFVPSMLRSFLDHYRAGWCPSVRHIVCSGEELSPALQNKCLECMPHARLSNLYGPTEAAVDVTAWECEEKELSRRVPIGRPIANIQMYVLDRYLQPTPIGVAGEIYIGGVGVGRGYLRRPELTAERFICDPFSTEPQARLYKTGDLGRWRADGAIEYLGRNDHQVKIRGHRIELGEIEAQLARHERVTEAVVIAREDVASDKRLVAYVTQRGESPPLVADLRATLQSSLPEYMVPAAFVILDRWPLTPNGKLDRRALPVPEREAYVSRQYEAPEGEAEQILAAIWEELLRVERVGRNDNFFEMGGNSLLMLEVVERLRHANFSAEIRHLFGSSTLADMACLLGNRSATQFKAPPNLIPPGCEELTPQMLPLVALERQDIERIVQSAPGGAANIQDVYPLAPLQEGILFHHLLDEQRGDTYVLSTLLSVSSREKVDQLVAAVQAVVDRHDVLRTAVLWEELPRPVQVVYRRVTLPYELVELDPKVSAMEQVKDWIRPERQRLDLRQAPLIRLQMAADPHSAQWFVLIQLHHIVCDHVTAELVTAEVLSHLQGRADQLPPSAPYRTHVAQALAYAAEHDATAFFRGKFADVDEPTAPFGLSDVYRDGSRIDEAHEELESGLALRVHTQARCLGVSAATLFHAAWALVIAHTSGRDDVVFGTLLMGRLRSDVGAQRVLGMFINTLPLRVRLQGVSAKRLVEQVQGELVELLEHEQASLAVAQACSGLVGSTPLFSALLNYVHSTPDPGSQWSSASGIRLLVDQERTNYPIALSVIDTRQRFTLVAQTDRRIDPHRITGYLHSAVRSLVQALEQTPQEAALALSILPQAERDRIVESFNATQVDYPRDALIHQLFERHAARTPHASAAVFGNEQLTYEQLNRKSNRLARILRAHGVRPDMRVGICVERGLDLVIGVLAILKSGGAFVPLDASYPVDRLLFMVQDSAPTVLLTQRPLRKIFGAIDIPILELDADLFPVRDDVAELDVTPPELTARNLASLIYTSGSTGRPKGVMVEHAGLRNMAHMQLQTLGIRPQSRVLQFSSPGFDACTWEWVMALCGGACLCLASRDDLAPGEPLLRTLQALRITHALLPPVALAALPSSDGLECLTTLMVGGEACPAGLAQKWARGRRFINAYGPTEATVCATMHDCDALDTGNPPIGRPIANLRIYILDRQGGVAPIGVVGEIHIGGAGIARGYFGRAELTAQRFVGDPFDATGRLYKTGDLGRWRADGTIEYLGRNDHQVKIRGFRIELGEIEVQLERHAQIREALVLAREDVPGEKYLAAYCIPQDGCMPGPEELRAYLRKILPEYMVPSAFVALERFPLTPNGKRDRRALPVPQLGSDVTRRYEPPQGDTEVAMADIWRGVLRLETAGRHDNFFDLGGHSLLVMKLMMQIRACFSLEVPMSLLFDAPTIRQLSERIDQLRHMRLLEKISDGGMEANELLERIASMPESRVHELLRELNVEARI